MALIRRLIVVCGCVLLVGCSDTDADFYFFHPRVLSYVLQQCELEEASSDRCDAAYTAARELRQYSRAYIQNQQTFGKMILAAEMELSALDEPPESDEHEEMTLKRDKMLFIVGLYSSPV